MKSCKPEIFFREVALRIHSSLEIGEAIKAAFNYMHDFIPMDMMGMYWAADVDNGGIKVFSVARYGQNVFNESDSVKKPVFWLSSEEVCELETFGFGHKKLINIDNSGNLPEPLLKIFANIKNYSVLEMEIGTNGYQDCFLVIAKDGKNVYRQHHADLLLSVMEPFSIAMSNAIRYLELLRLKEGLIDENQAMKADLERAGSDIIVGADFGLRKVMEMVKIVSRTSSPVLLHGETGTGKEIIAKYIHRTSPRRDGPFINVQCGAMPESLLDSELFGHEKGAFTGAVANKRGRFERAHGGTIFLDEIGELSAEAQVKLLRVLQEKEFERVGGQQTIKIDVRVLAATHRNLAEMVRQGKFREDLWFRLNVIPIEIPPLRERREDIPALIQYFILRKSRELNLGPCPELAPGNMDYLMQYDWPGNVRELQNLVERGLIISRGQFLEIPTTFISSPTPMTTGTRKTLDAVVKFHISKALEEASGKIYGPGGAAEFLGLNPNTLRSKLRKLGIPFGKKSR